MHPSTPITVAVAHFEDLLARGLRAVLESDPSLQIIARDVAPGRVAVVLRAHRPQVAILDVDALPNLAEVRRISREHPRTRLVLLAAHPTAAECAQLLAFGASACLTRRAQGRDVLNAIHLASRGLQLTPRSQDFGGGATPGSQLLTRREAEVLPMLQQGSSNAQIAVALHVGVETVRTHARNIYRKLGVSSRRTQSALPPRAVVAEAHPLITGRPHRWAAHPAVGPRRPGAPHRRDR